MAALARRAIERLWNSNNPIGSGDNSSVRGALTIVLIRKAGYLVFRDGVKTVKSFPDTGQNNCSTRSRSRYIRSQRRHAGSDQFQFGFLFDGRIDLTHNAIVDVCSVLQPDRKAHLYLNP